VFVNPDHYESIPAHLVGRSRSVAVDRFAGLHTLEFKCRELGLTAAPAELDAVLRQIKQDERASVNDDEFRAYLARARAPLVQQVRQ
jgi:isopropylmalate/homocitrate/citramalate synthase